MIQIRKDVFEFFFRFDLNSMAGYASTCLHEFNLHKCVPCITDESINLQVNNYVSFLD
ncbi:hypothetical protein KKA69_06405 [Patescibacteria group bacterium]|nr:hypothetical protein [Patescibacteria group bacterium]